MISSLRFLVTSEVLYGKNLHPHLASLHLLLLLKLPNRFLLLQLILFTIQIFNYPSERCVTASVLTLHSMLTVLRHCCMTTQTNLSSNLSWTAYDMAFGLLMKVTGMMIVMMLSRTIYLKR